MESQPQNPEFRINPENFHPCSLHVGYLFVLLLLSADFKKNLSVKSDSKWFGSRSGPIFC